MDQFIPRDTTPFGRFRDSFAMRIANFALNRIATPWYRNQIAGYILFGMTEAAKESSK